MKHITITYAYIINLSNAAQHHYKYCNDSECGVSLHQLRETAKFLTGFIDIKEKEEAINLVELMPNC